MHRPHTIAIIHARGGSKRVPFKNIKPLGGKPLIAWSIEAALNAKLLDRIIVSTDHEGIAAAARVAGAEVPFMRPGDIAEDVPSELVTRHAVEFHENETGKRIDIAVSIQPTTPFLEPHDIDACIQALIDRPIFESAMTVGPIHERPEWMFRRDESGLLENMCGVAISGDLGVSQTLEPLFIPNGGAYAARRETLYKYDSVAGGHCYGQAMDRTRSVDIDDPVDMLIAETIAAYLAGQQ